MRILVAALIAVLVCAAPAGALTVIHGQKTLDSSNGGENLSTAKNLTGLTVKAACANTVDVMVGGSALNYSSSKGRTLAPCEVLDVGPDPGATTFKITDLYFDAGTTASQILEYDATTP